MRNIFHEERFFQSFVSITSPSKCLNDSPPPHPTEREASTHNAPPSPSGQFHDAPSALSKIRLSSAQVSLVQSGSWVFAKSLAVSCQWTDFISELLSACKQNMRSPNSLAACQRKSATTNVAKVNVHDFLSAIIYSHLDAQIALWRRFAGGVQ